MNFRNKMSRSHELCFKTKNRTENGLVLVLFLAVMLTMSCTCLQSMPDDLIGIWKTRAPEYLTTFIQIKEKSIVIGQRGGTEKTFPIKGIKKKKVNKEWARYTIYCLDDERARFEVPILFSPYNRGIIRLANKKEISWTKTRNRTKEEGE